MKYGRFNKYEKKVIRKEMINQAMEGYGVYLFKNSSKVAELTLPRPTHSGIRKIAPDGEFQGDDYFLQLVKRGELRLVEVLQTAEEEKMAQEKLIVEQPEQVTVKGTVEHVVSQPRKVLKKKPVKEEKKVEESGEILLNECPVENLTAEI